MARQRKLTEERKNLINQRLSTYKPEDTDDVHSMLKDLLGDTLQGMLEAELEDRRLSKDIRRISQASRIRSYPCMPKV
nr:hypothetical protein [Aminipila sp.]